MRVMLLPGQLPEDTLFKNLNEHYMYVQTAELVSIAHEILSQGIFV
jgi:hypothetical protein